MERLADKTVDELKKIREDYVKKYKSKNYNNGTKRTNKKSIK